MVSLVLIIHRTGAQHIPTEGDEYRSGPFCNPKAYRNPTIKEASTCLLNISPPSN